MSLEGCLGFHHARMKGVMILLGGRINRSKGSRGKLRANSGAIELSNVIGALCGRTVKTGYKSVNKGLDCTVASLKHPTRGV